MPLSASLLFQPQPILFRSDLRFHLEDHLRQQLFTFLSGLGVNISRMLLAIRPDWGVAALPQVVVDLSDASGACLRRLPLYGWKVLGAGFRGADCFPV